MGKNEANSFLIGQIIVAVIGALVLLVNDFAGYYYNDAYNGIQVWGYVSIGSGFFTTTLIILGAGLLLYPAYSAYKILKAKEISKNELIKHAKTSFKFGIFAVAISTIGALIFVITNVINETQEWWLGSGFYAIFIAGVLISFLGKIMRDKYK